MISMRESVLIVKYYIYFRAKWVCVHGTKYQVPFAIVIGLDEDDIVQFGSVENIYVHKGVIFFEFIPLITHQYLDHFHAYAVVLPKVSERTLYLIKQSEIIDHHPYGLYTAHIVSELSNVQYIVLRSTVFKKS